MKKEAYYTVDITEPGVKKVAGFLTDCGTKFAPIWGPGYEYYTPPFPKVGEALPANYNFGKVKEYVIFDYDTRIVVGQETRCIAERYDWKPGKKEGQFVKRIGGVLVISEIGYIHDFGDDGFFGNLVQAKNGDWLFFADEKNGRHSFIRRQSKARSRFVSNSEIKNRELEKDGVLYCSLDKNFIYVIANKYF